MEVMEAPTDVRGGKAKGTALEGVIGIANVGAVITPVVVVNRPGRVIPRGMG